MLSSTRFLTIQRLIERHAKIISLLGTLGGCASGYYAYLSKQKHQEELNRHLQMLEKELASRASTEGEDHRDGILSSLIPSFSLLSHAESDLNTSPAAAPLNPAATPIALNPLHYFQVTSVIFFLFCCAGYFTGRRHAIRRTTDTLWASRSAQLSALRNRNSSTSRSSRKEPMNGAQTVVNLYGETPHQTAATPSRPTTTSKKSSSDSSSKSTRFDSILHSSRRKSRSRKTTSHQQDTLSSGDGFL